MENVLFLQEAKGKQEEPMTEFIIRVLDNGITVTNLTMGGHP